MTRGASSVSATTVPARTISTGDLRRGSTTSSRVALGPSRPSTLVARTERALLLTCLWYIREVDRSTLLLTGLTRDGVYLVEDGEIIGAVNNFRFNESPLDVLNKVVEAGQDARLRREWGEWCNRTAMPPLRVADFNMSSVSPAS